MQVTFTKEQLKKILEQPGDHVLINIGYGTKGDAKITAASYHPEAKTQGAVKAKGCPFPPGCPQK